MKRYTVDVCLTQYRRMSRSFQIGIDVNRKKDIPDAIRRLSEYKYVKLLIRKSGGKGL